MSKTIDYLFLLLAAGCMLAGPVLGIAMGIEQNFVLAPVHGHLNLMGASLALYGLTYRSFEGIAGATTKAAHLTLSGTASILFPVGLALELTRGAGILLLVAAPLWFLGAVTFVVVLVRGLATHRPWRRSPETVRSS